MSDERAAFEAELAAINEILAEMPASIDGTEVQHRIGFVKPSDVREDDKILGGLAVAYMRRWYTAAENDPKQWPSAKEFAPSEERTVLVRRRVA